jgi:hypothetical protein
LFIVPWPCAGTSTASPKAAKTTSAIRLDVSTLPAATAAGGRALTSDPSGPVEVELELVALDRQRDADLQLALGGLEDVDGGVSAVREPGDRSPHAPLGVGVQILHRRDDGVAPAPRAQLVDARGGQPVRGELRPEVAAPLFRVPHPCDERFDRVAVEPRRRDDHALLVERPRVGGQAARLPAAHVGMMRARGGVADGSA